MLRGLFAALFFFLTICPVQARGVFISPTSAEQGMRRPDLAVKAVSPDLILRQQPVFSSGRFLSREFSRDLAISQDASAISEDPLAISQDASAFSQDALESGLMPGNLLNTGQPWRIPRAAPATDLRYYWIAGGYGGGTHGWSGFACVSMHFGWANLLSYRTVISRQRPEDDRIPRALLWDVGALYGRAFSLGRDFVSLSTGVSLVGGEKKGELRPLAYGIPFEVQLFTRSSRLGLGVYAFANVNREQSFAGGAISVKFGKLRFRPDQD